jgi:hypothetical protein
LAIAALVLWMCTAAAGSYLLVTGLRARQAAPPAAERTRPEPQPVTAPLAQPPRARDRFDPPSLTRAKSEPLPGMRALAEFTHPALAITGLSFWLGYVLTRDRTFAAIGFGVLLGAIGAGLTWFAGNARATRRAAAGQAAEPGERLSFTPRLLILHGVGAALTLLLVALTVAR